MNAYLQRHKLDTLVLLALKHLEPITEEVAAAPAPAKKEARQ